MEDKNYLISFKASYFSKEAQKLCGLLSVHAYKKPILNIQSEAITNLISIINMSLKKEKIARKQIKEAGLIEEYIDKAKNIAYSRFYNCKWKKHPSFIPTPGIDE